MRCGQVLGPAADRHPKEIRDRMAGRSLDLGRLAIVLVPKSGELDMRIRTLCGFVVLAVVLAAVSLQAQDTASLTGTVTDPSGASVANAQVTVDNSERGIHRAVTTNQDGEYGVPALPAPATYDVTVTAKGFKKYQAKGVELKVAQKARNNVTLQVGSSTTEITVQGTPVAQVDTQTNEVAGTITGKEISQLQLTETGTDKFQMKEASGTTANLEWQRQRAQIFEQSKADSIKTAMNIFGDIGASRDQCPGRDLSPGRDQCARRDESPRAHQWAGEGWYFYRCRFRRCCFAPAASHQ